MTTFTQAYKAVISAPWLDKPEVQFCTFTFDDATPAQFPAMSESATNSIRKELARRSVFKDVDAVTTGDTWDATRAASLDVGALKILALWELIPGEAAEALTLASQIPNLMTPQYRQVDSGDGDPASVVSTVQTWNPENYVWPAAGWSGSNQFSTMTMGGTSFSSGKVNLGSPDTSPALVLAAHDDADQNIALYKVELAITNLGATLAYAAPTRSYESVGTLDANGDGTLEIATGKLATAGLNHCVLRLRDPVTGFVAARTFSFVFDNI